MAVFAVRPAQVPLVLGVGDELQMVWVPACIDAASVMQLLAFWDVAAKELPSKPVRIAVLGLGNAPVWGRRSGEAPAGAQLRMGWSEFGAVKKSLQLGATVPRPRPLAYGLGRDIAELGHVGACDVAAVSVPGVS
jgi:hypothetical protein